MTRGGTNAVEDSELVAAVLAGRREVFGQLVERHRAWVFQLCYRIAGNVPDAEDLAHEAFVEAYLKLSQLRDAEKFAPWLKAVALNLCRMWYRRNRRWATEPLLELPAETAAVE